jgi:hypothetical protein
VKWAARIRVGSLLTNGHVLRIVAKMTPGSIILTYIADDLSPRSSLWPAEVLDRRTMHEQNVPGRWWSRPEAWRPVGRAAWTAEPMAGAA